jgi:hypothetical protein
MKFFSGFSLNGEEIIFDGFLKKSDYTVCGFSYGAIKAFEYVKNNLKNGKRIDTLQLFSPAFFETKSEQFKRMQTLGYTKNKELYLTEFLKACYSPYPIQKINKRESSVQELEELLNYKWNIEELIELELKGVAVEVYLGEIDGVIDVSSAREFFEQCATITYIKNANHFLQVE